MKQQKYKRRFASQEIQVDGETLTVPILGPGATLPISLDLSDDMDRVAAQLGYWAAVAAAAKKQVIEVDAQYRAFRGHAINGILEKVPNLAEWKVKARVDSLDGFLQHKHAIAVAEETLATCLGIVQAFDKKANQLQSKGAKLRSEVGAQGMTTPKTERGWDLSGAGSKNDDDKPTLPDGTEQSASTSDDREKAMEAINKKRGAKKKAGKKTGKARTKKTKGDK